MVSPFRRPKKERRRLRKFATDIISNIARWEETNPDVAASLRRISELSTKIGQAKRRKKPSTSKT